MNYTTVLSDNQPSCCEENRKEISSHDNRITWLITEVNTLNNKTSSQNYEIYALQQRIAYLELPWWKKIQLRFS